MLGIWGRYGVHEEKLSFGLFMMCNRAKDEEKTGRVIDTHSAVGERNNNQRRANSRSRRTCQRTETRTTMHVAEAGMRKLDA